eukprot:6213349-Pleurochrysis_carterae.AAC.5
MAVGMQVGEVVRLADTSVAERVLILTIDAENHGQQKQAAREMDGQPSEACIATCEVEVLSTGEERRVPIGNLRQLEEFERASDTELAGPVALGETICMDIVGEYVASLAASSSQ